MRLPGEHQQDGQDPGSHDRDLHRSASDVTQNRLRHEQLRSAGEGPDLRPSCPSSAIPNQYGYLVSDLSHTVFVRSPRVISYGHRKSDICDPESDTFDATSHGLVTQEAEILENDDYRGFFQDRVLPVDSSHPAGPALVAAAADADPVTLLVLGWLAAHRSENTRTAYARDIGITPQRRPGRAP